ncbi:hypothetical protein [Miniphocaeibacter massiliensis]|uniref:hypothetical protein n=1 Tax=Miniphocaeibacter massiliensis TaxID=2041841 RepID=UPI000C1C4C93|nr:hypothetical protein [Miniphocaeibacter massiliensis]
MKKTIYRVLGIVIFVATLLIYSVNIHLASLENSVMILAGYITEGVLNRFSIYSRIIFVVSIITSVVVGIIIPKNIEE